MYSTGMLKKRIEIAKRVESTNGQFGKSSAGQKYQSMGKFWASETWNKGVKSLREGAVDAYDTVMFRMRWAKDVDRWCLIKYQGRWYQIQSLNEDYQRNEIQITATEMVNQNVTLVEPTAASETNETTT